MSVTANSVDADIRNDPTPEHYVDVEAAFAPMREAYQQHRDVMKAAGAFEVEAEDEWEHHGFSPKHGGTCSHTYPNGKSMSTCCDEDLPCGYVHDETAKFLVMVTRNGAWQTVDDIGNVCQDCRKLFTLWERKHTEWIEDPGGTWFFKSDPEKKFRKGKVTRSVRNDSKFCSNACRQRAYRERRTS